MRNRLRKNYENQEHLKQKVMLFLIMGVLLAAAAFRQHPQSGKKPAKPTIRGFPKIIPNLQQKNLISARRTQKTIKRQTVS